MNRRRRKPRIKRRRKWVGKEKGRDRRKRKKEGKRRRGERWQKGEKKE
jgi:hypothetical protein